MSTTSRIVFVLAITLAAQSSFAQSTDTTLTVEPKTVEVDLFYTGARIHVSGTSRAGRDLVLVCTGRERRVELKEKEKLWGFLWVNGNSVAFENVPSLYHVVSSQESQALGVKSAMFFAGIGFPALENRIVPKEDVAGQRCFPELIKLKQHEGLFSVREGSLEVQSGEGGMQKFSTTLEFPSSVTPGEYRLRLMGLVDGKPLTLGEQAISVRLAGTAALIRFLSSDHGLIYGILSVVIALAAGLFTGLIFGIRSGKGGH